VCAACHGADGNSGVPANPKLAQQHPQYLVKQLQDFKSGKRKNAIMAGFAGTLSDEDMRNIAYWVTAKTTKPGFAKDKELVSLGERIYRGGIADRQIAACAGCHSPNGAGIPAQYPRLGGQHADYVAAQLTSFRDGGRTNSPQMNQVTAKMKSRRWPTTWPACTDVLRAFGKPNARFSLPTKGGPYAMARPFSRMRCFP
jgi:cytochrome c553